MNTSAPFRSAAVSKHPGIRRSCRWTTFLFATLAPLAGLYAQTQYATPYAFTTLAGVAGAPGSVDGTGSVARFNLPWGVAVDASGNAYVTDDYNCTIRKVTSGGTVTTLAGAVGVYGQADGTGSAATFRHPHGIAVDGAGNLYVADTGNYTIRKITSGGNVTTLAGTAGFYGTWDGTGSAAAFINPQGVAVDGAGNVYVGDNNTVRKISSGGVVTTLAGTPGLYGSADGTGSAARFSHLAGVAVDGGGNIYVADVNNYSIRKITSGGVVTTLAGGTSGSADGTGSAASFQALSGVAVDGAGTVYVTDQYMVRKITSSGVVTTLAGSPDGVYGNGSADGSGGVARFDHPTDVAVDSAGSLYVADEYNSTIRKGGGQVAGDFNADGKPDITWQNTTSGDRGFWLMNGTTFSSWVDFGIVSTDWRVVATADFNADGKTDLLWENTVTGDRYLWFMNGSSVTSTALFATVATSWHIAAAADFNGDGRTDIVWENTVSGDRGFWLLTGSVSAPTITWRDLAVVPTVLRIVGAGDFNGDGQTDLVWENTSTGKRVIWLMNGTTFVSSVSLGVVATDWHIAAVADYNGDGKPDILFQNVVSGDRFIWLMNGTAYSSGVDLGIVSTDWDIAP